MIDIPALCRQLEQIGQRALVCMAGVQSNQFPRAFDISTRFTANGIPVCLGGFHVSGILSLLNKLTPELEAAQEKASHCLLAKPNRVDSIL